MIRLTIITLKNLQFLYSFDEFSSTKDINARFEIIQVGRSLFFLYSLFSEVHGAGFSLKHPYS